MFGSRVTAGVGVWTLRQFALKMAGVEVHAAVKAIVLVAARRLVKAYTYRPLGFKLCQF